MRQTGENLGQFNLFFCMSPLGDPHGANERTQCVKCTNCFTPSFALTNARPPYGMHLKCIDERGQFIQASSLGE